MGLDLTIYRQKKNGKRVELADFGRSGWSLVTYLARKHDNKDLYDAEVQVTVAELREMIECCKEVLLAYYNRSFDNPDSWVDIAIAVFDTYDEDYHDEYNEAYINDISDLYEELWKIQNEYYDDEILIFDISY